MKFLKTREVKSPERNAAENAGIDFFIPDLTESFVKDFKEKNPSVRSAESNNAEAALAVLNNDSWFNESNGDINIAPHKDVLIPSGIKSKFSNNIALIANNKSGVATKKKLIFGASVIDSSYQGEWHLHLINTSDNYQTVSCGQKVIQFIPHYIVTDDIEIVKCTESEFFTEASSRGAGGFGSTGDR